ncbi:hypothetical protein ACN47E_003474 [Coniothyrium glycines]
MLAGPFMTSSKSTLCCQCAAIFTRANFNALDQETNIIAGSLHTDVLPELPRLKQREDDGCKFCTEVRKRILSRDWAESVDLTIGPVKLIHESFWESDLTPEQEGVWMIEIAVRSPKQSTTIRFDIFAHPGSYASTKLRVRRRPPSQDRLSPDCTAILRGWISSCTGVHWQCDSGDESFWPTRVIDVGPADGSVAARLMVTTGEAQEYVALSHCWGKPGPGIRTLKTLSENFEAHQEYIPMSSMPLNYQDAINVTRALGLRYIWIDSLCIFQDSVEDWAREGSQMHKIYKCALVTLVATSAATSEDGFLEYLLDESTFNLTIPLEERLDDNSNEVPDSLDRRILARYAATQSSSRLMEDVDEATWNTRGWTLQERYLARRLIHFGRGQIFWECRRGYKTECGQRILQLPISVARPYGDNDSSSEDTSDDDSEQENPAEDTLDGQAPTNDTETVSKRAIESEEERARLKYHLYMWWYRVLAEYTRRALTYATDKLPAISGSAQETNALHLEVFGHEDTYIAGLWLGSLADGLLWMPEDPATITSSGDDTLPTWSWARWNGATTPCPADSTTLDPSSNMIEHLSHDLVLDSANAYGRVRNACLTLRACIMEIEVCGPTSRPGRTFRHNVNIPDSNVKVAIATLDTVSYDFEADAKKMYAMQVRAQTPQEHRPGRESHYSGLVIRRIEGLMYERVGVFMLEEEFLDVFLSIEKKIITLV